MATNSSVCFAATFSMNRGGAEIQSCSKKHIAQEYDTFSSKISRFEPYFNKKCAKKITGLNTAPLLFLCRYTL